MEQNKREEKPQIITIMTTASRLDVMRFPCRVDVNDIYIEEIDPFKWCTLKYKDSVYGGKHETYISYDVAQKIIKDYPFVFTGDVNKIGEIIEMINKPVGDTFRYNGIEYEVGENDNEWKPRCDKCSFYAIKHNRYSCMASSGQYDRTIPQCKGYYREDKKDVYFKKFNYRRTK